jgi:hypothetical protein
MADNVERIGAIIQVEYNGQENVQRYIADLERLGVISGYVASRFNQIWSGVATGVIQARDAVVQLNRALGQTGENRGAALQRFDWALEGNRRVRTLDQSLQALDRTMQRLESRQQGGRGTLAIGDLQAQIRAQLVQAAATQIGAGARGTLGSVPIAQASPQQLTEARAQRASLDRNTAATDRLVRAVEAATRGNREGSSTSVGSIERAAPLQLESPQVVAARLAEVRALQQSATETRQLTSAVNRLLARAGGSSISDAELVAPGTVGTVSEGTSARVASALGNQLKLLDAEMARVLSTARALTNEERIYAAQQSNAGRIRSLIGAGTRDDYNDTLLDAAQSAEAGRVRRGSASYGLLSQGTVNQSYGHALGTDALRLLGIDPQQLYGFKKTSYVQAPGFVDYRTASFSSESDLRAAELQNQRARLLGAYSDRFGLGSQPFGAGQALALRSPSGVVPYGNPLIRYGREFPVNPGYALPAGAVPSAASPLSGTFSHADTLNEGRIVQAMRLLQAGATQEQASSAYGQTNDTVRAAMERLASATTQAAAGAERMAAAESTAASQIRGQITTGYAKGFTPGISGAGFTTGAIGPAQAYIPGNGFYLNPGGSSYNGLSTTPGGTRYYTGYTPPPPRLLGPGSTSGNYPVPLTYNPATGSYGAAGYGGSGGGLPPTGGPPPLPSSSAGGGGIFSQFGLGFRGRSDRPYAEQIGQAFKFSVFYGTAYKLLFAITQTFGDALQQAIQFEQATTDLALATGRTSDEVSGVADELGKTAARAGFSPAEGVEAGARAVGLFGLTGAPLARQATAAQTSAQITSMLALGNQGRTFQDIQTDLAATTQAFGLGYQGQSYLADLDAYFSKKYGIVSGATLQPIAETAALGSSAGFSLEQQASISALLQARTGQTPSAVGGLLSQLFSRTGDSTVNSIAARYNIPTQGRTLSQIIGGLGGVFQNASQPEQNEIAAAFGRGRSQNAAQLLLQNYSQIIGTAKDAQGGSLGLAQKQFEARLNNIGGRIAQLSGAFHEFALQLGSTGIINVLGLFVVGLTKGLDAVNGVLSIFNLLPGPMRELLIATGLLTLAFKTGAVQSVLSRGITSGVGGSIFSRIGGAAGYATPIAYGSNGAISAAGVPTLVRGGGLLSTPIVARGSTLQAFGNEARIAAGAAGAAEAGLGATAAAAGSSAFAALVNPVTIAIGGLLAIGAIKSSMDRYHAAVDQAEGVISDFAEQNPNVRDITPDALRGYASTLAGQSDQVRGSIGGFTNFITFGHAGDQAERMADNLSRSAQFAKAVADRLEAAAPDNPVTQLQSLDPDAISTAFTNIANNGGTATQQLRFLSAAIFSVGARADAAAHSFRPREFADTIGVGTRGTIQDALLAHGDFDLKTKFVVSPYSSRGGQNVPIGADNFADNLSEQAISSALQDSFKARGIRSQADLGPKNARIVSGDAAAQIAASLPDFGDLTAEAQAEVIAIIQATIRRQLVDQSHDVRSNVRRRVLSRSEATSSTNAITQGLSDQLGSLSESDFKGRSRVLQANLGRLRGIDRQTPDNVPRLVQAIDDVEIQLAENRINRLEVLRRVEQRNSSSQREAASRGRAILRREIAAAVRGGDSDRLVAILEQAGPYAVAIAKDAIDKALAVAKAAATTTQYVISYVEDEAGRLQHVITQVQVLGNSPQLRALRALARASGNAQSATHSDDVYGGGGSAYNTGPDVAADTGPQYTAAQRAAAAAAANAARGGGGVSAARAALQGASADLAAEKEGTVAYYQALQAYYEAQQGLTDAIRQYHDVLAQLSIDTTNPLKMANLALREAQKKLEQDIKAGKDPDVIAQDRLDVQNAQTEQESTRFQQRLDRAQTADQLGRSSHQAYIRYLDNERDRLEAIKNRTYQQQQELNQIDGLLQDAQNALSGQFNLGDINLPTPYQVRRYIDQSTGGVASGAGSVPTPPTKPPQVNITIDGADTGQIKRVLNEILGANGHRSSTSRRKVRS